MRALLVLWTGVALAAAPTGAAAQDQAAGPWQLRTRIVLTGSSDESEPAGYQVYSAIALEAAVRRSLGAATALELSVRNESREVDLDLGGDEPVPQGSAELLPVTLTWLYAPRRAGAVKPYIGVGVNATITWEKSGNLNSADLTPELGPALQGGVDWQLTPRSLLNLDVRWHTLRPDLEQEGERLARLRWDTLGLGIGVGVRL